MRISDWSSDVCSSDLAAGIIARRIEARDRPRLCIERAAVPIGAHAARGADIARIEPDGVEGRPFDRTQVGIRPDPPVAIIAADRFRYPAMLVVPARALASLEAV